MRSPAPCPAHRSFADTSGNIFRSTGATICPKFFSFFCLLFSSYFSLLLIFFQSYLLILLFLSLFILLILHVLFFVFLFFFSYIWICLLYYRHAGGQAFFDPFGAKVYTCATILFFISLLILLFLFLLILLILYSSSSYSCITDMRIKHTLGKVTYINGKINDLQRKPRENSSLAKNPPKYTTANIVQ